MKCFNCGTDCAEYLCSQCRTEEVLSKIYLDITAKKDECGNEYVKEYVETLENPYDVRNSIPEIIKHFDKETAEYYWCKYYYFTRNSLLEECAITYIEKHSKEEKRTQEILSDLLYFYARNDFIKPQKWCQYIHETDGLYCELYDHAAEYYSWIGEYDYADELIAKATYYCNNPSYNKFLYRSAESELENLAKLKHLVVRYRNGNPYWPKTEERRRAVAMFYDEKGIAYPRIETKPFKVKENEFEPIKECFDEPADYCAFWCEGASTASAAKPIYQIAAVKIRNGVIVGEFQSLVRPWDGQMSRKDTAKRSGLPLEQIESAEDVDLIMPKFFEFVGDDMLVSTGALGNQAKLISRAARYAGMKKINNGFFDLLDFAADTSSEFDLANNTRKFLLSYFNMSEGNNALSKAKINVAIFEKLLNWGV